MPKEVTDNYGVKWITMEGPDGSTVKVTEQAFNEVWKDKGWKRVRAAAPSPPPPPKESTKKES